VSGPLRRGLMQVIDDIGTLGPLHHPGSATIDGDAHDPRLQRPARVPALQAAEDAQENLLRDIFSVLAMVEQADAQAEYVRLVTVHERLNRGFVPFEAPTYQDGVLSQHVLPRC